MVPVLLSSFAIGNAIDIPLGACSDFAVEAGTAITFAGTVTTITTGSIGVSPGTSIGGNVILGTGSFERTSTRSTACAKDLDIAYLAVSSATPTIILRLTPSLKLPTADLSGLTLGPGVYSSTGSIIISATSVTLDGGGDPNAQFIFQAKTNLITSTVTSFILTNGAQAANVYWSVGMGATLGHASSFVGTILAGTAVVFDTDSVLLGRALAHTAVTFAGLSTVTLPTVSAIVTMSAVSSASPVKALLSDNNQRGSRSRYSASSVVAPIDLGGCTDFAVQTGTSASFNGIRSVIGQGSVGVSPGSSITGSYQIKDGSAEINTGSANKCAADRVTAYNAAGAAVCPLDHTMNELSDQTLLPGVYCTAGGRMTLSAGSVTLDAQGNSDAVWIFQVASALMVSPDTTVLLANGAQAKNVFWQVGSSATLSYSSSFVGTILSYAAISVDKNAAVNGRALAGAGVSFASNNFISTPAQ